MKFHKQWKDECCAMYRNGKTIKEITNFIWPKAKRSEWLSYGIAKKSELSEYLSDYIPTWSAK